MSFEAVKIWHAIATHIVIHRGSDSDPQRTYVVRLFFRVEWVCVDQKGRVPFVVLADFNRDSNHCPSPVPFT